MMGTSVKPEGAMIRIRSQIELGRAIREHRKAAKMSQIDLARLADTTMETVSRIETGRYENCGFALVLRLMDALDLEMGFSSSADPVADDDFSDIDAAVAPFPGGGR
jgi:transcriptional regulator with XRE-family HTH domain